MNLYVEMKKRHREEMENFPMLFAFNKQQLEEGMKKLEVHSTNELHYAGAGCFYKKTDAKLLHDMIARQEKELEEGIKDDKIGDGFIFQMFDYELSNHEYCITGDETDTLEILGISSEDLEKNDNLRYGFVLARNNQ